MNTQPKTIADLDATQARLARQPRPHALLATDIADRFADEMRYLADDLAEQANLWRIGDLTASDDGVQRMIGDPRSGKDPSEHGPQGLGVAAGTGLLRTAEHAQGRARGTGPRIGDEKTGAEGGVDGDDAHDHKPRPSPTAGVRRLTGPVRGPRSGSRRGPRAEAPGRAARARR